MVVSLIAHQLNYYPDEDKNDLALKERKEKKRIFIDSTPIKDS